MTVIVCTRDRPELLRGCLDALQAALRSGDELIVVDSASTDDTTRAVVGETEARYLRAERPGLSVARNVGWKAATHALIAFVDDDVRVTPDWAATMASTLGAGYDFVTGRVDVPAGQEDIDRPVAIADDPQAIEVDAKSFGFWGHGANMGTRRDSLEQLRGFDELLGAGGRFPAGEDYDFFDRVFALDGRGRYEPAVRAVHEQWRSRRSLLRLDHGYGMGAGARVSKLLRSKAAGARRRGTREAATYLWSIGIADAVRCLLKGAEWGALYALARAAGFVRGLVAAMLIPVRAGHLRSRRRS